MGVAQPSLIEGRGTFAGAILPPVYRVSTPLEHAQALWPGYAAGLPQGTKSIWPTPHHKDRERLVDQMIYVRSKLSDEEQQADLCASQDYLQALKGKPDKYISLNTFNGRRVHANLRCLTGLVVDLDLSKTNYGTDFMVMRQDALDAISAAGIPSPTMAVHTGRGVHLYWLFDRTIPAKVFPRWKACTNQLITLLAPFGADPAVRDTARVLRLVGTRNTKAVWVDPVNGGKRLWTVTAEVFRPQRHSFDFLADQILPVTRQELEAKRKARASNSVTELGTHQARKQKLLRPRLLNKSNSYIGVAIARQGDIDLLASTLHPQGIPEGLRDTYLFHTACNLAWICRDQTLENELMKWRDAHVPGMPDTELLSTMGTALRRAKAAYECQSKGGWTSNYDDERYVFAGDTLWDVFGVEVTGANLRDQMRAILPRADRQERAKDRKKSLRQGKQLTTYTGKGIRACNVPLAMQAMQMAGAGLSLRKIALQLGKSPKTIKSWLALSPQDLGQPPNMTSCPQDDPKLEALPKCSLNNGVANQALGLVFDQTKQVEQTIDKAGETHSKTKPRAQVASGRLDQEEGGFSPGLLAALRTMPVHEVLERVGIHAKKDVSFKPKKDSRTEAWHVSLTSGAVVEVIFTNLKWFIRSDGIGGVGGIDLVMHLTDRSFFSVVHLFLEQA